MLAFPDKHGGGAARPRPARHLRLGVRCDQEADDPQLPTPYRLDRYDDHDHGHELLGVSAVRIAGLKVAYKVRSSTRITATVPAGGQGKVSVTTKGGTATSAAARCLRTERLGHVELGGHERRPGSTGDVLGFTYTAATGASAAEPWRSRCRRAGRRRSRPTRRAAPRPRPAPSRPAGRRSPSPGLTLAAGATATITYGAVSGGACTANDGATAATAGAALSGRRSRSPCRGPHQPRCLAVGQRPRPTAPAR